MLGDGHTDFCVGTWVGFGAGNRGRENTERFVRVSAHSAFSLLRLGRDSRYLVPTHLSQKLQDGPFPLCEHINQGLDEAGAFFVMSVGKVPCGWQKSGLRGAPTEVCVV